MRGRNHIEVHSENTADYSSWCKATGDNCQNFHYLVHPEVYIINVQVLHAYHYIAIVFTKIMSLDDMIMNILKIFCGAVFQELAFTSDYTSYEITHRYNISF